MKPVGNSSAVGFLLVCDQKIPGIYSVCERYGDGPLGAEGASINTAKPTAIVRTRINCLFHKNEHTAVAFCRHFKIKMFYMYEQSSNLQNKCSVYTTAAVCDSKERLPHFYVRWGPLSLPKPFGETIYVLSET